MSDIVVVDSGQTYESTESAIVAKNEADRAEQWAKYSEEKANLSEQSALEAAQYKDDAKASADFAASTVNGFDTHANERQAQFDANAVEKQAAVDASAETARKWAVGTISEQPAGSSKYWAEYAKSVTAGTLNETQITNCITKIPQDIKLELNNGTLTLKAGSRVYDGAGNVINIAKDLFYNYSGSNRQYMIFTKNNIIYAREAGKCYSGNTAPTGLDSIIDYFWYDTANKDVKRSTDGGESWVGGFSLPLGLITVTAGTGVTSIDQVFNGFGYVGSTVFALPGVKGLIPNGRNADGSLKNIEFTYNEVKFFTNTYARVTTYLALSTNGIVGLAGKTNTSYDEVANKNFDHVASVYTDWCTIGTAVTDYNAKIAGFANIQPFRAVDYNDYAEDIQKCKLIAYDADHNPGSVSGNFTAVLQDWHERFSIPVVDNVTITIDTSQLTFPKGWYTIVFEIYFPNGAKTVNLSYAGGIRWVNGLTPNFTNGRSHLVALTKHRVWGDIVMSDAGTLGG